MHFPTIVLACALVSSITVRAQTPDPQAILEGARLATTLTTLDQGLNGNLTQNRKKVPVALFLKGKNIQFQFAENGGPWRAFHMRLNDNAYDLFEIINGKTTNFSRDKLVQPIAGTDLTYEDLAFRFFYWPNPIFEGEEKIAGNSCYKLRLNKPGSAAGRYEAVYVWIHTKYGAFMQIRGYDKNGGLLKEFQVRDVMQVDKDVWTLKKMQVSSYDPNTNRRISITDVVFDTPPKTAPRGVR